MNEPRGSLAFIGLLVALCLGAALVRAPWAAAVRESESRTFDQTFGSEHGARVRQRAHVWYGFVMKSSGAEDRLREMFTRTSERQARSGEFARGPWAEGIDAFGIRLEAVFDYGRLIADRLSAICFCLPVLMPAMFACGVDGWVRRRIRQNSFAYASPLRQRLALSLFQFGVVGFLLSLIVPAPMPLGVAPAFLMAAAAFLGCAIAYTQKRL